jgi:hypothetical protein
MIILDNLITNSMNYYQIDRIGEAKIIGIKTGTSQVELVESNIEKNQAYFDFENHFSGYNKNFWYIQDRGFKLNPPTLKGKLRKNAKVTDLMWYGSVYQYLFEMYSEKYIDIIKSFNIGKFKIFDFDIEDVSEKYYLMFIETIILDSIHFDKSTVVTGYKHLNTIKYHSIKSKDEFVEFKQKEPISTFEKLAISKTYYGKDIIAVQGAGKNFYSEKLIDFLLDCKITGLQVAYNNSIQLEFV